jgi:hypothetical protein
MLYTSIGSAAITILMIIIYALLNQSSEYISTNFKNIEYIIFPLGIYSGHFFYKRKNNEFMSYSQGLQIGVIISLLCGIIIGLFNYLYTKKLDPDFGQTLIKEISKNIHNTQNIDIELIQNKLIEIQSYLTPQVIFFVSTVIVLVFGTLLTLVLTLFTVNKETQED